MAGFLNILKSRNLLYVINNAIKNRNFQFLMKDRFILSNIFKRNFSATKDVASTAVVKDKLLYVYKQNSFYLFINTGAFLQFVVLCFLGKSVYYLKPIEKGDFERFSNLPWYMKFDASGYKNWISGLCFIAGTIPMLLAQIFTMRSVSMVVLRKCRKKVSIVTNTPIGRSRIIDVPLEKVSAKSRRSDALAYLPIKIKGKFFHFIIDKEGEYINPHLFDQTVGIKRF